MTAARRISLLYWIATLWIALTGFAAGVVDILRAPPLYEQLLELGYPPHFATVLGVWKVLGALALTIPRRPLLKEWAYAGMFFDFTGALVAHAAAGHPAIRFAGVLVSLAALLVSWCLRPRSRRLAETQRR